MAISSVELTYESALAYLQASYATEFSIENPVERTGFRPCVVSAVKTEIVLAYWGDWLGERLIIVEKESSGISKFISATLYLGEKQMLVTYYDARRKWEVRLRINFLNKYLPEIA